MSFQVCSCGWSKVTTYQGLRIHQGKKGCTPKGMRIPESEQFRYNSHVPQMTFAVPTIKMPEHFEDLLSSLTKSEAEQNMWINVWGTHRGESRPNANREPRIQESEQLRFNRVVPQLALPRPPIREAEPLFTPLTKPGPPVREAEPLVEVFPTFTLSEGMNNIQLHRREDSRQRESRLTDNAPVKHETLSMSLAPLTLGTSMNLGTPLNLGSHLNLGTPAKSAAAEVVLEATNQQLFQTPPPAFNTTSRARRTLDFHTGAVQLEQQIGFNTPTTASQERQQKQKDRERQRKEQQLAKERHDAIRADLQLKIQMIEIKMAEVKLSSKQCKVSLDTEWLEINNVFSDVMRDVEEARDKALQPLEERRHRVKRETEVFVEKLEKETDQLKKAIEELEQNQDLQVSPLTCLDDSWKTVTVDTSFSFGTLRTTTSNMIKNIQKKLEQLSSTELRRTSKFEVDVKLDPATAHPFLELSRDGKKVTEGGKDQRVPYSPERFDMFGSVLGLNRFPSGKSYWEVEVRNKTGWDLGVARGDANRKGKLTLTPDNGYWVTVHYENEKYAAMATPPTSLALTEKPQKVGVFVDYEEGLVSFYNVMAKSHIYSFTGCLFNGEIVPYFSPHLKENGKNSAPLIISAVN
nr:E3 ubiquitin-protein ligase TRIM21-like isoform X2 [Labrus bergylta]XP_020504462.1 E3 ubiquitin-protein ligase TRIM21-like isoform X2 [Labrus bergylta]